MKRSKRIFHLVIEHRLFSKTVKILRIKARYKITKENIKRLSIWHQCASSEQQGSFPTPICKKVRFLDPNPSK